MIMKKTRREFSRPSLYAPSLFSSTLTFQSLRDGDDIRLMVGIPVVRYDLRSRHDVCVYVLRLLHRLFPVTKIQDNYEALE
jgi:hypothetical protein